MRSFKQFLQEEDPITADEQKFLRLTGIKRDPDGQLHVHHAIHIADTETQIRMWCVDNGDGRKLKYQLESVNGDFAAGNLDLNTLENCPTRVQGSLDLWGNKFTSMTGITPFIYGDFLSITHNDDLKSLTGVGKMIKSCKRIILPGLLKGHLLGVVLIPKLEMIRTTEDEISPEQCPELTKAIYIINDHLKNEDHDVMDCHEELTRAGLKEFAKL